MKIDFHTHGKLAKKLPFSTIYTDWLLNQARIAGLDAICLTEHFNSLQFAEVYRYIASIGCKQGDTLLMENGLRVFPGMETDVAEGGHILCIGPMEAILELNQRLEPHKTKGNFLPFAQLMDLFAQYPVRVGCAHPFREGGHVPELPTDQLAQLDFVDLNGKDLAMDAQRTQQVTQAFANQLGIPMVSGSDTHQALQYGCVWTRFDRECTQVEALYQQMQEGAYRIEVQPDLQFRVNTAGLFKKALKEIHALGGDYVSVLVSE